LDLRFVLFDTSHSGSFMALMHISQKTENNIYNDSKLVAEVYSENNIENNRNRVVFNLCAVTNLTCPILAGTQYSAETHFIISNDTKVVTVSVSTEYDKHFGCEVYIFHNINIPTLTASIPTSTPHP
ncbi:19433_t:CDS:1, partial [Gigaspora rosea]